MPPAFLDSNVFLYAVGAEHRLREPCRAVLRRVAGGDLEAVTSVEVVKEVVHVLTRRGRAKDAHHVGRNILSAFDSVLPVTKSTMAEAIDILDGGGELPVRDAVHAATMRHAGVTEIITADRDFDRVEGVRRVDPTAVP